ncbi:glutamine-hydrolyzing GMP synthase [Anaeromassilibacillus sp. An200]|uniref:glutamine-hydrolyzing GMP synthase n=1 Tax=Anaeromassilibacillus sp. An200 TaxID=1965587 RepID=UPI000B397B01|nr:glutamine-hydrolyzing GMP synthase [Anaeromassilibacillus sp. An200]OUP13909.1 GMP synthase (glutamine-hydrolyzing) [Anaeromassilibacillus sp. An200]
MKQDMIVILDLGSTENARVARAVRALGVYSEIYPHDTSLDQLKALPNVKGLILSGGENRIVDGVEVDVDKAVYESDFPKLTVNHPKAPSQDAAVWPENDEELKKLLSGFVFDRCGAQANWSMKNFIDDQVELIRRQVGDKKVLLALSGGVDSSVVAALLIRAIGNQLTCVHVNHGLLRKGEPEQVVQVFRDELKANLIYVDAVDRFLDKLAGVSDPEQKRKIIGAEFIRVFEEEARKLDGIDFLAQGTIYPDIIESGTKTAKAVKAHHNVGGLPDDLKFELVEPLKMLFKDEVRACGKELGLPDSMVYRQPFPGPGLGVRCLGAITRDRLEAVRESDAILREEFAKAGLEGKVWQYFTIVPDFRSVGVRDNARSFEWPVILRAVNTIDAMTASVEPLEFALLQKITQRIVNEVPGVNRVLYDLTPKPCGTIEWE